jgi:hypothetical protein
MIGRWLCKIGLHRTLVEVGPLFGVRKRCQRPGCGKSRGTT